MTIQQGKPFGGNNRTTLQEVRASSLKLLPGEPRRHSKQDLELARETVRRLPAGAPLPIVINGDLEILDGLEFVDAAREIGIESLLVLQHDGMTPVQEKQYRVAIDQLQSRGSWDPGGLEEWVRLFESDIENFDHAMLGFDSGELDRVLGIPDRIGGEEAAVPSATSTAISERGLIWKLGHHRLMVGDATSSDDFQLLMAGKTADAAITDPPYGCPVDGFVAKKGKHRDFIEGAGDKSPDELAEFFSAFARNLSGALRPGALIFSFIDWRSLHLLQRACEPIFGSLVQLVCWVKDRGGMGGLYRSQHELVLVYRRAGGMNVNAVRLGKHGRNRSNVWSHPCAASSRGGREGDMLKNHPTPKPVEMIADAILDCTHVGDAVVDPFLGSGTTLIAAERTGRVCHGLELDPRYADVAIRRWQNWTGVDAVLESDGRTFNQIEAMLSEVSSK